MNKATIIIGKVRSGKSMMSRAFVLRLKDEEAIFLNESILISKFPFSECAKNTKAIVVDEVKNVEELLFLLFKTIDGVNVEKPSQESFRIYPRIIIVCNEQITRQGIQQHLGSLFQKKIVVIETIS